MKVRFLKPVQVNWTGNQGDNAITVGKQDALTLVTRHLQRERTKSHFQLIPKLSGFKFSTKEYGN